MPVAKLLGTGSADEMKAEEGNDSLDNFIRQAVGKEPLFSFSRTGDSPVQWIQLLHALDQQDLPGWPLLAPMKVQMQKCDKCAREFCSPINYRRHIRVHRRSLNFNKESQKYRDLLGAFWDKLSYDEAKDIMSFKDVNLEEVPGSSIVRNITANLRKPVFLSLPQLYVKAGSVLVDIIQGRPSRLPIFSQELFSILDDASERTFLRAGTAESLQKFVFDGEAGKIGLENRNLIACTSFLVEQRLVKAWLADKDAEALRCQKLLVEEEEAAQRRQAVVLERKRQRKLRQKEQRARDEVKGDVYGEVDSFVPDEALQLSNNEVEAEGSDHSDAMNSKHLHHLVARWQKGGGRNGYHQGNKRRSKVWTKKPRPENGNGNGVENESRCELMIGSISVTVRSPGQDEVEENVKKNSHCSIKIWRPRHDSRGELADRSRKAKEGESDGEALPFCVDAAKAFLAQRWKEAISGEHSKLVVAEAEVEFKKNANNVRGNLVSKGVKTKYIPKQRGGSG